MEEEWSGGIEEKEVKRSVARCNNSVWFPPRDGRRSKEREIIIPTLLAGYLDTRALAQVSWMRTCPPRCPPREVSTYNLV